MTAAEPPRDCDRCPRLVAYRQATAVEHPELVQRRRALLRRPGGARAGARPCTRRQGGEPDGPALHRRLRRRSALCHADEIRLRQRRLRGGSRRTVWNCATASSRTPCAAFRPATSRRRPRSLPAGPSSLPGSRPCSGCARSSVSAGSPTRPCCARWARGWPPHPFAHGARHDIGGLEIFDSYHCSRYNTNTGRLTPAMFEAVFADLRRRLDAPGPVSPASA